MSIELFFRNFKYLFRYNLKHMHKYASDEYKDHILHYIDNMIMNHEYETNNSFNINILNAWSTIRYLNSHPYISISRFGDGEIAMIENKSGGVFQKYEPKLRDMLKNVLVCKDNQLIIGINYYFYKYKNINNLYDRQKLFYMATSVDYRIILDKYIDYNKTYVDSAFTSPYHLYKEFDFKNYYLELSNLWRNQDIVLICGKTVFDKLKYNIFESANSIEYIECPSVNAFSYYDDIKFRALNTSKNKRIFIILGQTATVLAYELSEKGHVSYDIGHIAKDYNAFCLKQTLSRESIVNFYGKD